MSTMATPAVIAHRGACGYLPEHTLQAVELAHQQGADYLEQDVVLTADGIPIVLHDVTLELTTNVASLFEGRQRDDGLFYAIDFTLAEIKQLTAHERTDLSGNAVFPDRYSGDGVHFEIPTLAEEIELVDALNAFISS
jgi:glycerophosphoryl diester phosphodiesterase